MVLCERVVLSFRVDSIFSIRIHINFSVISDLPFRFRLKYHPEDSVKRKEEQMAALKVRYNWF